MRARGDSSTPMGRLIAARGLTTEELARRTHLSATLIRGLVYGYYPHNPKAPTVHRIAEALGLSYRGMLQIIRRSKAA